MTLTKVVCWYIDILTSLHVLIVLAIVSEYVYWKYLLNCTLKGERIKAELEHSGYILKFPTSTALFGGVSLLWLMWRYGDMFQ